jgi:hypothetical protein
MRPADLSGIGALSRVPVFGYPAVPEPQIKFRRCPACGRTEMVGTNEVVATGRDHQRCTAPVEHWVRSHGRPVEPTSGVRNRRLRGAYSSLMTDGFGLTRDTHLSFVIELINGSKTMGDVEAHFRILNDE